MLILLVAAGIAVAVLAAGAVLTVVHAVRPASGSADSASASDAVGSGPASTTVPTDRVAVEDALAARPMPVVPESVSRPGPLSDRDPGAPILLPSATSTGPAGVPTGFPHTPEGALAQLAAIDLVALQSASLAGARAVISAWAMPGGPTTTSWSGVRAVVRLLDAAGLSGGGSTQFAVVLTPLMGLIKGSVGSDFVVPCIDFQLAVTLQRTARGAVADCQRMVWRTDRWVIGPGAEPATPPSVWPGTDVAFSVGYRDLRHG
ncbi:hypothetical protein [Modestobacter marinus]|uniref:hypothetical protein n=1 Tax=Modestobacter marinus TaxID=477641 RepID=UPI00201AF87F|nr:hypothetical protein [Modestobacter marinus]